MPTHCKNLFLTVLFSAGLCYASTGQNAGDSGSDRYYEKWGLRSFAGNIVTHAEDIENTSGSIPAAIELEYSRRRTDSAVWQVCRCYPTTGVSLAYKDYNNEILGRGVHVAYFVQHHFFPAKKINPFIRGTAGGGYASNPHHAAKNPDNRSYSFRLNAYLQVSGGVEFPLAENWLTSAFLSFNHLSNGGLKKPNRGINWPAAGVSLHYSPRYQLPQNRKQENQMPDSPAERISHEFYLFGSAASHDYGEEKRLPLYGTGFQSGYALSSLHKVTAGLEWHLDKGHEYRMEALEIEGDPNRAGFLAGHEFTMGRFAFSQQLGVYIYDRAQYHDPVYHRWGVRYIHSGGISAGINLKVHRHIAEFADFRLGFAF